MNRQEAVARWAQHQATYAAKGLILPGAQMYLPDEWKQTGERSLAQIAMDAAGTLSTDPNGAIPAILTTAIDPDVIRVVFAPLQMAEIVGERKAGTWLDQTRIFPIVEDTGEVTTYGDYNNDGRAGINFNYPNFQSYLFQTIVGYGELELERNGLMRINYVGELNRAAAELLNRYGNLAYAFGITGLQNYGIINNPYLSAYITPATKAWGGSTWFNNGSPAATANEVYNDILALVERMISQTNGNMDANSKMTLAMGPGPALALQFVNSFGVFVKALLKEGFPNMTVKTAVQYGAQTSTNSQGYSAAGNAMQLILDDFGGGKTCYGAFTEKMKSHKIIAELSAWKQKYSAGTWGTILRTPAGVTGMLGI